MREFEQNADTDLIRAAPDMYDVLGIARIRLESYSNQSEQDRELNAGLLKLIEKTMAKARGA